MTVKSDKKAIDERKENRGRELKQLHLKIDDTDSRLQKVIDTLKSMSANCKLKVPA